MKYFVTAIGTDSGKTVFSAVLTEFLRADYWKPIQAGFPRDRDSVRELVDESIHFHDERFLLNTPASPHMAARIDEVEILPVDFVSPQTARDLVVEGAGGLMVPINDQDMMIDLIPALSDECILVCNLYLGSINHSLLSIEALKARKINVKGIVFNGSSNPDSETIILQKSGWPCLLKMDQEKEINKEVIKKYAAKLADTWM